MATLTEKIKKFFDGWCACGSKEKTAQPPCCEESKPQEEKAQPSAEQSADQPQAGQCCEKPGE